MVTFHTTADVPEDRRIVLDLPPDTPLGKAELIVTIGPEASEPNDRKGARAWFGSIRSGDTRSADNEQIDADLARAYQNRHE